METQVIKVNKPIHPLVWIAGIAVILFSVAGIAAIMGWIPTSFGNPSDNAVLEKHSTNTAKPAVPKAHTVPVQIASNTSSKVK